MKIAESMQPEVGSATQEELVVVLQRLKSFDVDRRTTTPSHEVFRNLVPELQPTSQP